MSNRRRIINPQTELLTIGEFARRAGVTIRTLRFYDKIGLLKPHAYAPSGRRLYSQHDYARLQQILTLKLIGLSLDDIHGLLTTDRVEIDRLLRRQKCALEQKVKHLLATIRAIEHAQRMMAASPDSDWTQFIEIIKAVNMDVQTDWISQFITPDQQQKVQQISQRWTIIGQKQTGEAWIDLFCEIYAHMGDDLADPEVQALVARWDALIDTFAQGDAEFAGRLTAAYEAMGDAFAAPDVPDDLREWAGQMQQAAQFVQQAREAAQTND